MTENLSIEVRTALFRIGSGPNRRDIIFPERARVVPCEFSPFRAGPEPICTVYIPAIVNFQARELTHTICDGDPVYAF